MPSPKPGPERGKLSRALFFPYHVVISPALHLFSHLVGGSGLGCRFEPTCSRYAEEAYSRYGFLRGTGLTLERLLRCHPFSRGGSDPLPCQTPDIRST